MAHPPSQYSPQHSGPPSPFPYPQQSSPPPQQYSTAQPNKRAKLSPNPPSPYGPPSYMANGLAPNPNFPQQQQYQLAPPPQNGYQSHPPTNAPPTPTGTVMGPPSRPVEEKPADLNDLSDVLYSAGIDVRSEEAALVQRNYNNQHDPRSFETAVGSFNSNLSLSQNAYYDSTPYLSQNAPGDRASFYGAGAFNQPAVTPEAAEQQYARAKRESLRNKCLAMQYELREPFCHSRSIYKKLVTQVRKSQIRFPDGKAIHATELNPPSYHIDLTVLPQPEVSNLDNYLAMIDSFGTTAMLPSQGSIADIATLLSLAAKERVRAMLEDSAALARGRRISSHGVVPSDLKNLSTGRGEPAEATSAISPTTKSLKRSFSEINSLPTPESSTQASPQNTVAFPNALASAILKSVESEASLEEARAAKRSKRNVDTLMSGDPSRAGSISGTPGPGTPGTPGERAPDVLPKKGLSKKEQKRLSDAKASEAQQVAATSSSLNMALGTTGNLFGGKKISWMSSKKSSADSGFGPPRVPPAQSAREKAREAAKKAGGDGQKFGQWREDREGGKGIQLRDLLGVLEPEPKEKKALAKAYHRLGPKR